MRGAALLLALACALPAQAPAGKAALAVRCGKLYVGDGRVLERAWLIVRDGKIVNVLPQGQPQPDLPIVDASDKVVMPGIVAADSDLAGHADAPYTVTPDFTALEGFDFTKRQEKALSGGVTTAYLAPGRVRLIPGQGSVVKLHGDDLVHRVLAETACLRLTLGRESTLAPALFEPTAAPTSDDPLVPSRRQVPSARISQLAELRRIFAEAVADTQEKLLGPGHPEDRYEAGALQRAAKGELPLRVAARSAADLRRAIDLAKSMKARLVLENPSELERVATAAATDGVLATFRIPVRPGLTNQGGEDKLAEKGQALLTPEAPGKAAQAGVHVAIVPGSDDDFDDFLLVAAIAVRHGLTPEQALLAITSDAARALGVDGRVGTLAEGKDADFLVLSGEPFAIGTMVEKTFVDGKVAWERPAGEELLAVRATKIITGEGQVFRDGVILCENGKIRAIGEDLTIPHGARIVRIDGVLVPGFVDAFTHVGLSGQGQGIPNGSADQLVADAVNPRDPLLRQVCEAGVTTVMVSGRDTGLVSGRAAALKTGANDRAGMVLRDIAAIRFVQDTIGPDAIKPLADAIARGKQYIETWQAYEKSLKDPNAAKPVIQQPTEAVKEDPVSGTWDLELKDSPIPIQLTFRLFLKLEGTKVSGKSQVRIPNRETPAVEISSGSFENGKLVLELRALGQQPGKLEAEIADDKLTGTLAAGQMGTLKIAGTRTSKEGAESTSSSTAASNKPRVDQSLEPIKALLEKRAPAIVRAGKGPAIEAVIAWFEEQKLPYVLQGADDAVDSPALLGKAKPAQVVLTPETVTGPGKQAMNAPKKLVENGAHVAICSAATSGSRYLPLHAAYAVRYGLDPEAALAAVTIEPARMFLLDDRIGSLKRGKDADFTVFSGHPFDPQSHVELVVVNGRIVVDKRTTKGATK